LTDTTEDELPLVSVVVPMLDEIGAIEACLDSFEAQSYPHHRLDVIVVDGGSADGSRAYVETRTAAAPWLRVVDNPQRRAASAFNRGLEAARGEVVCLFSAHGVADPEFVARSVEALSSSGAAGVGGRLEHEGVDPVARAVGLAMMSPVGMASPFRYATERRDVDTIGHPAYWRDALERVGGFDESLERNSDYEINWRLREGGDRLVFEPSIVTRYRPRGSVRGLARQFWWYGRWKERVVRRHPRSLRPRHLVPPAFVTAVGLVPVLVRTRGGRRLVVAGAVLYGAVVAVGVVQAHPRRHDADPVVLAACFPVMHASWGAGFLASLAEDVARWRRDRPAHDRDTP
jgi:succinoglycan biosynthesis protein ExoA